MMLARMHPARRGSVVFIVLWTIALAALATAATQLHAFRQAGFGREALERTQARWAARGGIEASIQAMINNTEQPFEDDMKAVMLDLEIVHAGALPGARYSIEHSREGETWQGPFDESARLNINVANQGLLMVLEDMTFDLADAIVDWVDVDSDPGAFGVEADYYRALTPPLTPRNGRVRALAELELVAGVYPRSFRGEDWNLNGRLDPNENDAGSSLPYDQPDGLLDAGWSEFLTTYSIEGGPTMSGKPRAWLRAADPVELAEQLEITEDQAGSLIYFGRNPENTLEMLWQTPINQVGPDGSAGTSVINPAAEPFTDEEIKRIFHEVTIADPLDRTPGRMNINTVSPRFLRDLLELWQEDPWLADEIVYLRETSPTGIAHMVDLLEIPELEQSLLDQLTTLFTTNTAVFSIVSRGISDVSGLEVEIIAVVDRSTLPIRIIEYREQ